MLGIVALVFIVLSLENASRGIYKRNFIVTAQVIEICGAVETLIEKLINYTLSTKNIVIILVCVAEIVFAVLLDNIAKKLIDKHNRKMQITQQQMQNQNPNIK